MCSARRLLVNASVLCGTLMLGGSAVAQEMVTAPQRTQDVAPPQVLDRFDALTGWGAFPAEGVALKLLPSPGVTGQAMTLAYDFQGKAGYAIARKSFAIGTPAGNWSFSFKARGAMRPNTLEFKLLDKSGDNVWWYTIPDFQATAAWQTVVVRQRQISFAWGPVGGGPPRDIASIELVVTAGTGGRGALTVDDLVFTPLPVDVPVSGVASVTATHTEASSDARFAVDGDTSTVWRAKTQSAPTLLLDLGGVRTYGGLVVDWAGAQRAAVVRVDTSNDGAEWSSAGRIDGATTNRSYLPIPDGSSRYLRLRFQAASTGASSIVGVQNVSLRPLNFASSPTAFLESVAGDAPRGNFPRSMHNEQIYWSIVGVSGGNSEALLSEDGQLELAKRGPSLEPVLTIGDRTITWNDVKLSQSLLDSVRPIPSVTWNADNISLIVTAFAAGTEQNSSIYARYRLINHGTTRATGTLALALRPIQVNPPWQFLNTPGGAARVDSVTANDSSVVVNGALRVRLLTQGARVGATTFDGGEAVSWIVQHRIPSARSIVDQRSLGSAVMSWPVDIAPGDSTDVVVTAALDGKGDPNAIKRGTSKQVQLATNARIADVAQTWATDQDAVTLHLPPSAPALLPALRANLAWILINRDGPGIQPGSRSYERSWIRDGSLTSEALLRLGRGDEAKQFAEWFAQYQYPSGKVPCCVDKRGADPVDEHDSHGEFIHLVYETWRYTGDSAFAERMWPHVQLAAHFIDSLRTTHLTSAYNGDSLIAFRGLLPASISHEGYSAKPMHSIWDDGFALLGLREAEALRRDLGKGDSVLESPPVEKIRQSPSVNGGNVPMATGDAGLFDRDLTTALSRAMQAHNISYIPGSIELGDFDATSTTTLLSPGNAAGLPKAALDSTFARYFRSARDRINPDSAWENYTPYEWRTVGSLLRLGKKSEALTMVQQFMGDRRPLAWQQWAEVVWHDKRAPKFLGDMPHTWVGSDFIRSALDLFAYEQSCEQVAAPSKDAYQPQCGLIVGAGISALWLAGGDSVAIHGLRTTTGVLGYSVRLVNRAVTISFDSGPNAVHGRVIVHSPLDSRALRAEADGVDVPVQLDGTVVLTAVPRTLVLTHP